MDMDNDGNYFYTHEIASSYYIKIASIQYDEPEVIHIDTSKWDIKPSTHNFETDGFDITF